MADAAERLVNLALYVASRRAHVTAAECRAAGLGYPDHQDEASFLRMFERDKDALRAAGLVIDVDRTGETEAYRLDAAATFARPIDLTAAEVTTIRAVAAALAEDPAFPFGADLALALGKLGVAGREGPLAAAELAEESAAAQGEYARALAEAVHARKRVTFGYTNAQGADKSHRVDPYGVFFREGRWYLTGADQDTGEVRTYAVGRMRDLDVNPARPHTPDFEPPADFDVREHERLPFQYGAETVEARVRFGPDAAWRAERLTRGRGRLETLPDSSVVWTIDALDLERLATWIIAEGPGIKPVEPPELVRTMQTGLRSVVELHG